MSRMSSIVGMCEESVERQNGLDLHEMNTWKKRGLLPIHFPFWIAMPRFEWNNRIMACVIVAHVFRNYFFTIELFHHNKHKHVYLDHPSPPKKHEAFKQTSSVFWDVCFFFFEFERREKTFFINLWLEKTWRYSWLIGVRRVVSQSGKYYGNTSDLSSGTFSEGGEKVHGCELFVADVMFFGQHGEKLPSQDVWRFHTT